MSNATTSITVTPTAADANATIKVNTVTVASGSASASIPLVVGANPVNVVVTAQDGTTIQTYAITVNRASPAQSNNAALSNLVVSAGTLTPSFVSTTLSYSDAVSNATASINVTPTTADANATRHRERQRSHGRRRGADYAASSGSNPITIVVTAQDGTTTQTYTINVDRASPAQSNNAALSSLVVSGGHADPVVRRRHVELRRRGIERDTSITITPTTADANATIKVDSNATVASGSASSPIALAVGSNPVNVTVTAQNGTTTQTYTINVTRAGVGGHDVQRHQCDRHRHRQRDVVGRRCGVFDRIGVAGHAAGRAAVERDVPGWPVPVQRQRLHRLDHHDRQFPDGLHRRREVLEIRSDVGTAERALVHARRGQQRFAGRVTPRHSPSPTADSATTISPPTAPSSMRADRA